MPDEEQLERKMDEHWEKISESKVSDLVEKEQASDKISVMLEDAARAVKYCEETTKHNNVFEGGVCIRCFNAEQHTAYLEHKVERLKGFIGDIKKGVDAFNNCRPDVDRARYVLALGFLFEIIDQADKYRLNDDFDTAEAEKVVDDYMKNTCEQEDDIS